VSLLDIHVLGSPVLRRETVPVAAVTDEHRRLIADMFETMYAAQGIGLAAPQVGRTERICVIDVEDRRLALVNPEIVQRDGKIKWEEGCLSIPDVYGDVQRASHVVVRALDEQGEPLEVEASDLLAVCLQHEIDHLHGRLFIDHLCILKRRAALAKWETVKGQYVENRRTLPAREIAQHQSRPDEGM
jgi:peptide deformylase